MNTLQSHVLETQSVHSVPEITKLVSINVKHAQKEVKFVNILCLSALIVVRKNVRPSDNNAAASELLAYADASELLAYAYECKGAIAAAN
ncbi:uncharacterized protein BDCG_16524 [Blastomyces dermatitidis ER-3]|uniref:Uncharacterized protein n=1 Tax=Ajellomyces dermatitidis (strain ER-3 / ATCC MYA-2586) TaxID=559297 RepID=A0ABX2VSN2_AJEDR|nr:uncharacterized protein BDCG_16524 [Blastomyces dermatitidis ER-3]OAT00223.1 hypothetical protein BDCG_16524 [Blastomyces dermatitidis ER-3]